MFSTYSELRAEDVVVNQQDRKVFVTNWNREGDDSTGVIRGVLDYDKVRVFAHKISTQRQREIGG